MPWFPELFAGQALADTLERHLAERMPFYDGLRQLEPDALAESFAAEPLVDDPRFGRIHGREAFAGYVEAIRAWLRDETTGAVAPVRVTHVPLRSVEEVSIGLAGEHPELPVAIVSDLTGDGCIEAIRVYHSLWPLTGTHEVRAPLLEPDPSIELHGAPADYQRALAAGDADALAAACEPGEAQRGISDVTHAGGGISLRLCTATDDGTACAVEYICDRWGSEAIPPRAGVAVFERGATGRLQAARVYDDLAPPERDG